MSTEKLAGNSSIWDGWFRHPSQCFDTKKKAQVFVNLGLSSFERGSLLLGGISRIRDGLAVHLAFFHVLFVSLLHSGLVLGGGGSRGVLNLLGSMGSSHQERNRS